MYYTCICYTCNTPVFLQCNTLKTPHIQYNTINNLYCTEYLTKLSLKYITSLNHISIYTMYAFVNKYVFNKIFWRLLEKELFLWWQAGHYTAWVLLSEMTCHLYILVMSGEHVQNFRTYLQKVHGWEEHCLNWLSLSLSLIEWPGMITRTDSNCQKKSCSFGSRFGKVKLGHNVVNVLSKNEIYLCWLHKVFEHVQNFHTQLPTLHKWEEHYSNG